jgi:hypothetical protein
MSIKELGYAELLKFAEEELAALMQIKHPSCYECDQIVDLARLVTMCHGEPWGKLTLRCEEPDGCEDFDRMVKELELFESDVVRVEIKGKRVSAKVLEGPLHKVVAGSFIIRDIINKYPLLNNDSYNKVEKS